MKPFLTSYALVWLVVYVVAMTFTQPSPWIAPPIPLRVSFLITMLVIPVTVTAAIAQTVQLLRPRQRFSEQIPRPVRLRVLGTTAGCLSWVLSAVVASYVSDQVHDAVITGGASALVTLVVVACLRSFQPHRCPRCSYDLRGQPLGSGLKCPECGARPSPVP